MKKIVLLITTVLISGCIIASALARETHQQKMDSWMSKPEVALIRSMGPPDNVYWAGGVKFLTYGISRTVHIPGEEPIYMAMNIGGFPVLDAFDDGEPATTEVYFCRTTFEIRGGIIRAAKWKGNACD